MKDIILRLLVWFLILLICACPFFAVYNLVNSWNTAGWMLVFVLSSILIGRIISDVKDEGKKLNGEENNEVEEKEDGK